MTKSYQIQELQGIYHQLSFPVLGILHVKNDMIFSINEAFRSQFLPLEESDQINFILKLMKAVDLKKVWHHAGDIYHIDQTTQTNQGSYYFFSLSKQSIHSSYLWLKHDLLNVLNPIMGFADILSESEGIQDDDQMLIEKIKSNAEKMYDQFQKLSVLQNLSRDHIKQDKGHYYFYDFMIELADKIQVYEASCHIEENTNPKMNYVNGRIGQAHFRSALEEFLLFLSKHQPRATFQFSLNSQHQSENLFITIPNCNIPEQLQTELLTIEQFSEAMSQIKRLQLSTINYLIICEWMQIMGGKSQLIFNDNEVILILKMPMIQINKIDNPKTQRITYTEKHFKPVDQTFIFPEPLYIDLKKLWETFDGLIILDDWNDLLLKLRGINHEYKNNELDEIIIDTESAIHNFDVEKLRNIYKKMTHLLN